MDSYLIGFGVIGLGMILAGFNLLVTIIHFRAPGMSWGRIPIFVWSVLATAVLLTLATPTLVAAGLFGVLDRTTQTAFFVNEHVAAAASCGKTCSPVLRPSRGLHHGPARLRHRGRN